MGANLTSSGIRSNTSGKIYISAVGGAFVATFFDYVRNQDLSALKKTAVAIRDIAGFSGASTGSHIVAIVVLCAVAAVLVCAYQPRETKESFLLGLSVLVVAGLSVPPVPTTGVVAKSDIASAHALINKLIPISTAFAEPLTRPNERMVWVFVDGPGQRHIPEVRLLAYSGISGKLELNTLVNTKFYMLIPAGPHQIEISRFGYKSVSFEIDPIQGISAYRVKLSEVKLSSLANFLGPQSIKIDQDAGLTELLQNSINECQAKNSVAAANYALQAGINKDKIDRDSRNLLCL